MSQVILTQLPIEDLQGMIEGAVQRTLNQLLNKESQSQNEELVTREQAANLLGISLPTLHHYSKHGIIPAYRIGSRVRFKRGELLDCLKKVQTMKYRPQ
jgi:excisionase family DNA binding protein